MNIYTSYFDMLFKIPKELVPIAICGKSPDYYKGLEYKKLAPKRGFFQKWLNDHDNKAYIASYEEEVIDKLIKKEVYNELSQKSGGKDVVLICYEEPLDFCHRHQAANWLGGVSELCLGCSKMCRHTRLCMKGKVMDLQIAKLISS